MLRRFRKFGSTATGGAAFLSSVVPFGIIGGLLYAGLFVKADAVVHKVEAPAIERRDNYVSLSVPAPNVVWAAGTGGKVVQSRDGGKSWVSQATGTQNSLLGIAAWDPEHAVAVGNLGTIIRTADAAVVERLILTGITACPPKSGLSKTALGSEETVPWEHSWDAIAVLDRLRQQRRQPRPRRHQQTHGHFLAGMENRLQHAREHQYQRRQPRQWRLRLAASQH